MIKSILAIMATFNFLFFSVSTAQTNTYPSSGNVGIGTVTPTAKLEVIHIGTIGGQWNPSNSFLTLREGDNSLIMDSNEIYGSGPLFFGSANGDIASFRNVSSGIAIDRMTIKANGNVGIGNATPSEKLHVSGNILSDKLLLNDPNTTSDWNMNWQSGFFQSYDATNAPEANQWFWGINMNHDANNTSYRYNGQIAIRNSSTSPAMYFRSTDVNGSGIWARIVNSVGNQYISGKLGLGTTTYGNHKLAVEGSIGAREIKVEASGWSDFVFEKKYDLPSLNEVEQHIKEKGHLKDIPSAQEVEKNGIQLGEMNAKLLQKIEELTLYTIQQEKQLNEKEVKMIALEKKINTQEERLDKLEKLLKKI